MGGRGPDGDALPEDMGPANLTPEVFESLLLADVFLAAILSERARLQDRQFDIDVGRQFTVGEPEEAASIVHTDIGAHPSIRVRRSTG